MTHATIRRSLSSFFGLCAFAFCAAIASSEASSQGYWDHHLGPRGNAFTTNRGQSRPTSQTPSMSRPGSNSLSETEVKQELLLTDEQ
jgi:hypothetical protein